MVNTVNITSYVQPRSSSMIQNTKGLKDIKYNSPENLSHPSSVRQHLLRFKYAKVTRAAQRINNFYNELNIIDFL